MAWTLMVDQQKETPIQRIAGTLTCRYAYARAAESQAAREKGQDFLTLSERDHFFTFVLCDGVSLSTTILIACQSESAPQKSSQPAAPSAQQPATQAQPAAPAAQSTPATPQAQPAQARPQQPVNGKLSFFFHSFDMNVSGASYTVDHPENNTQTVVTSAGAKSGSLTIHPDGTYVWNSTWEGRVINGTWRETGDNSYPILLLQGEDHRDWKVGPDKGTNIIIWDQNAISKVGRLIQ